MTVPEPLGRHLAFDLGVWPPPTGGLTVVESQRRTEPGWDGSIRPVRGVSTPVGTVLSVPPGCAEAVRSLGADVDTIGPKLPEALALTGWRWNVGVFRYSDAPADLDRPGIWVAPDAPGVPEWLRPFNGDVLIGCHQGTVTAGVGRKQHDRWGHEVAVVTEEAYRGQGWAVRLVAQAAHRIMEDGATPIYLHSPANEASARTAVAAGFPDRGWKVLSLFPR